MKNINLIAIVFTAFTSFSLSTSNAQNQVYNIQSFGAQEGVEALQTSSIQAAIDAANTNGGGKVIIPQGSFVSGSIILKSNVELHLEEGAELLGSYDPKDYKRINNARAFLLADKARNFSITGQGEVNGRGRTVALNADSLHHSGVVVDPNYNSRRMRTNNRPRLIQFAYCKDIKIEDATFRDGASWMLSFEQCDDMLINRVTVDSDAYWNNDGFDFSDCKNIRITNCSVNSADDGICLKSHTEGKMNENIYIANCTVRSSASAIKFGTASSGGFKNIRIENIKVYDTFRSAIALESVDGGVLEDVNINNINAINTGNAIFIRLGHRNIEGKVGTLRNISISNVKVQVPFDRPDANYDLRGPELPFFHNPFPASITGIPGHNVENVILKNISVSYPGRSNNGLAYKSIYFLDNIPENESAYPEFHMFGELPAWGMFVRHVDGLKMENISFQLEETDFRSAFVFDDVTKLELEAVNIDKKGGIHPVVFRNVSNANLKAVKISGKNLEEIKCIEGCEEVEIR